MSKQIIIIGASIAGLSAGIYARLSGFDAIVLEQHNIPGGMCTGWRRKEYLFDGSMHWMTGSSPKVEANELWQEVGALNSDVKVRYDEPFWSMEYEGEIIYLYRNLQKLEQHFNELSPTDTAATKQFISAVKAFSGMQMPIMDIKGVKVENPRKMSVRSMIKMMPHLPLMNRVSKMDAPEYISQFKSPAIRMILSSVVPEDYNATSLLATMATLAIGDGGYPQGGSLAMIKRMADKFVGLGGKISY